MSTTYRIKFYKGEEVKYISHLDLMRSILRSFKRAGILLSHSEGYNPHPKLAFGLPLPVGMSSKACYMDAVLKEYLNPNILIERLNRQLPEGIKTTKAVICEQKASIMKLVCAAKYQIQIKADNLNAEECAEHIRAILKQKNIFVEKKRKKRTKTVDIKPMVRDIDFQLKNLKSVVLDVLCDAGSVRNLSPMLLKKAIIKHSCYDLESISMVRTGLYRDDQKVLTPII